MFRGQRAWFCRSVGHDLQEFWAAQGGAICSVREADFLFSCDASHPDTMRIYQSFDYMEDNATVFHAYYLSAIANADMKNTVPLGHYILPPTCLQKEIRKKIGSFIWEQNNHVMTEKSLAKSTLSQLNPPLSKTNWHSLPLIPADSLEQRLIYQEDSFYGQFASIFSNVFEKVFNAFLLEKMERYLSDDNTARWVQMWLNDWTQRHDEVKPSEIQKQLRENTELLTQPEKDLSISTKRHFSRTPVTGKQLYYPLQNYPVNNMVTGYVSIDTMKKFLGELHDFIPGSSGYLAYHVQKEINVFSAVKNKLKRKC